MIQSFSDSELKDLLEEMYASNAANLVEEMPAIVVQRIIKQVNSEKRKDINLILQYSENSASSIMTTEFVSLSLGTTIGEAMRNFTWQSV
mgnify:CR=1 FL=1